MLILAAPLSDLPPRKKNYLFQFINVRIGPQQGGSHGVDFPFEMTCSPSPGFSHGKSNNDPSHTLAKSLLWVLPSPLAYAASTIVFRIEVPFSNVFVSHSRRIGSYLTGEISPNGTHLRCGVRTLHQILVVDIRRHLSVRHMTLFFSPSMHPSFSIICLFFYVPMQTPFAFGLMPTHLPFSLYLSLSLVFSQTLKAPTF